MNDLRDRVERCVDAYNRHEAARFASFFAEDGVLHIAATGETNTGRGGIASGAGARWAALDYSLDHRGVYVSGDHVWFEWTMNGTHVGDIAGAPATHRRVEGLLGCSHFTFRPDGLIARDLVYFDAATMLGQLGLLPDPATSQTS